MLCFCYSYTIPVEEGSVVRVAIMLYFCYSYTLSPANRYIIPKERTHGLCSAAHKRIDLANSSMQASGCILVNYGIGAEGCVCFEGAEGKKERGKGVGIECREGVVGEITG